MSKTAVYFATESGTSQKFAEKIADLLDCDLYNVGDSELETMAGYDNLVFVTSFRGWGAPVSGWGGKIKFFNAKVDLKGKKIALVGVGSQERHADSFCSGLQDFALKLGDSARFVGDSPASDYKFEFSRAKKGDKMIGLCLDDGDGDAKNDERLNKWLETVKPAFA